jgi:hypothetical protein
MAVKSKSESTLNQYDYEPEYKPAEEVDAAIAHAESVDPAYKAKADARRAAAAAVYVKR